MNELGPVIAKLQGRVLVVCLHFFVGPRTLLPVLSLILPTYNEAKNITTLIPAVQGVLKDVPFEIIVVDDDSPDGTWQVVQEEFAEDSTVQVVRRVGRRGLASAVIEGFLDAKGDVLAVMDADGQHDMELLPVLYNAVQNEKSGIALGSRYIDGGSVGEWDEGRHLLSRIATKLALLLCSVKVRDPMSGFFAIEKNLFQSVFSKLNPKGFKVLLDLLVCVPKNTKVTEHPFTFSAREHGESKLSWQVQVEFLEYLYDVSFGRLLPLTFLKYCIVGSLGVGVNLSAFSILASFGGEDLSYAGFSYALIGATEVAILFNFLLNNVWTFSRARLRGKAAIGGFFKYNLACLFGAIASYAVGSFLFTRGFEPLVCATVGAFTSVVWNYTLGRMLTWRT